MKQVLPRFCSPTSPRGLLDLLDAQSMEAVLHPAAGRLREVLDADDALATMAVELLMRSRPDPDCNRGSSSLCGKLLSAGPALRALEVDALVSSSLPAVDRESLSSYREDRLDWLPRNRERDASPDEREVLVSDAVVLWLGGRVKKREPTERAVDADDGVTSMLLDGELVFRARGNGLRIDTRSCGSLLYRSRYRSSGDVAFAAFEYTRELLLLLLA